MTTIRKSSIIAEGEDVSCTSVSRKDRALLSRKEAAVRLAMSEKTLSRTLRRLGVPVVQFVPSGRVYLRWEDVEALIAKATRYPLERSAPVRRSRQSVVKDTGMEEWLQKCREEARGS